MVTLYCGCAVQYSYSPPIYGDQVWCYRCNAATYVATGAGKKRKRGRKQ